jgi:hypothetical protein
MSEVWISAAEAYDRISRVIPFRAAEAICSRAFDGLIAARARLLVIGEKRAEEAAVPREFWWAKGQAALEQKWVSGDFETWIDNRIQCRAYGVQFREIDIEAMLPTTGRVRKVQPAGQGNFAPAARCVAELRDSLGCTKEEAGRHILRFCRAGLIDSRCQNIWWEVTDRYGPSEHDEDHVTVPEWFWEHCSQGSAAILNWDTGSFAGRGLVNGELHKVRIKGVEFDVSGIIDLEFMLKREPEPVVDDEPKGADQVAKPSVAGGRPRSEKWIDWVAELAAYIHFNGIPTGEGVEGQDALIAAIDQKLIDAGREGLSRSTVQPIVRAVLGRLRSAEN